MDEGKGPGPVSHEDVAKLLPYYELGTLSQQERWLVENHALECDSCFAELERGSAVFAAMRERRTDLLYRPEEEAGVLERLRRSLAGLRPRFAVPAVAVMVVLAVGLWMLGSEGPDPRSLATFPRERVDPGTIRGPELNDALRELMDAGAAYFDLERYDEAERYFLAALERDPELWEAAYLLGLSRALAGRIEEALPHLVRAARLAPEDTRPKMTWVLANGYLKAGRLAEAKETLAALGREEGEWAERAGDLLERLP